MAPTKTVPRADPVTAQNVQKCSSSTTFMSYLLPIVVYTPYHTHIIHIHTHTNTHSRIHTFALLAPRTVKASCLSFHFSSHAANGGLARPQSKFLAALLRDTKRKKKISFVDIICVHCFCASSVTTSETSRFPIRYLSNIKQCLLCEKRSVLNPNTLQKVHTNIFSHISDGTFQVISYRAVSSRECHFVSKKL